MELYNTKSLSIISDCPVRGKWIYNFNADSSIQQYRRKIRLKIEFGILRSEGCTIIEIDRALEIPTGTESVLAIEIRPINGGYSICVSEWKTCNPLS
jgi:hypothetical protein